MGGSKLGRADLTRTAVLAALGRHGPMSRASIARELGLSPAAVGQVIGRLIKQRLVEELDFGPSTGGRPGHRLGLVGDAGSAVGAKITLDNLTMVKVRLDGHVMASAVEHIDAQEPFVVDRYGTYLQDFAQTEDVPLLGVGICVPGIVDRPDLGNVDVRALGWGHVPLGGHLRAMLGVPILVENGVKALAFGECLYGLGRTRETFAVVTIGRGVGFAWVTDGTVRRGPHGSAGEIGHVVVDSRGPICTCGNRGCLEAFAGEDGLVTAGRTSGVLGADEGLDRLAALADAGDRRAVAVYKRAARALASFLAGVLAVLDPEVLLVAGEGTIAWRHWEEPFLVTLRDQTPEWARTVPVEIDSWEDTTWAQGAAAMVLATPFDESPVAGTQRQQVLARLNQ
jgi:predicted NBD/HSP70 family sugar kinase